MIADNPDAKSNTVNLIDWDKDLKRPGREFPRKFLMPEIDLSNWSDIENYTNDLEERMIRNQKEFDLWVRDYSEFDNCITEEGSRLYIRMTCDTSDSDIEKRYVDFVENLEPKLEEFQNNIHKKLDESPFQDRLKGSRYEQWARSIKTRLKLFKIENLPLHTKIALTTQEYQKLSGGLTVEWEGKTKTLTQMNPVLEDSDRSKREKAWNTIWKKRQEQRGEFQTLFEKMFKLRKTVASNLGLNDFVEYSFLNYNRTDYTPQDCVQFHETVKECVVPLYKEILEERRKRLGVDTLRPWDLSCDIFSDQPLKPYGETSQLINKVSDIFGKIDPELQQFYNTMRDNRLLDLENRTGKAPGGYQCDLDEVRYPFIFMNAVKSNRDVYTLLHESGHSFHAFLARDLPLSSLREAPLEFGEVASMSMERFGMQYMYEFYTEEERARSILSEDEEVFRLFIWIAIVDKFQHWLYTHPEHDRADRTLKWMELHQEYGCGVDWSGLEKFQEISWHRQLHIFELPFYYIEYGIAQLGALQFWKKYLKDPQTTLTHYKKALSKGGTLGLRDLFRAAGLKLDFTPATMKPLLNAVYGEWSELKAKV